MVRDEDRGARGEERRGRAQHGDLVVDDQERSRGRLAVEADLDVARGDGGCHVVEEQRSARRENEADRGIGLDQDLHPDSLGGGRAKRLEDRRDRGARGASAPARVEGEPHRPRRFSNDEGNALRSVLLAHPDARGTAHVPPRRRWRGRKRRLDPRVHVGHGREVTGELLIPSLKKRVEGAALADQPIPLRTVAVRGLHEPLRHESVQRLVDPTARDACAAGDGFRVELPARQLGEKGRGLVDREPEVIPHLLDFAAAGPSQDWNPR